MLKELFCKHDYISDFYTIDFVDQVFYVQEKICIECGKTIKKIDTFDDEDFE